MRNFPRGDHLGLRFKKPNAGEYISPKALHNLNYAQTLELLKVEVLNNL